MSALNDSLKDAVAAVKQFGEPIEVFWIYEKDDCSDFGSPWDQDIHGAWMSDLATMPDLRRWLKGRAPDQRNITIYCRGDSRDVTFSTPL